MDNLTHSLVGALIGQAGLKRKTGLAMPALIIGANIPDVDATCVLLDGTEHLALRRGVTHGPIAWVLLPLVLAAVLYGYDRWQAKRGKRPEGRAPVHFGWLFGLSFIACLTHPAMDWLNVYGIRLLEPFSHQWFYGDTLFIVDVWLWLGMGFATWFSLRREKRGGNWRMPAWIALTAVLAYVGLNALITKGAVFGISENRAFDDERRIASPVPVWFWQREIIRGRQGFYVLIDPDIASIDYSKTDPEDDARFISQRGECELTEEDYPAIIAAAPEAKPFLFWSRAPFIQRAADGEFYLRDARFSSPISASFELRLPDWPCRPFDRPSGPALW